MSYTDIANSPYLTKEDKIRAINSLGEAERLAIDEENTKAMNRIKQGSALQVASGLPILNIPYIGTGLGGAMYEAGNAIMQGKPQNEVLKDTARGFAIGESVGAVPYIGKFAGKTKTGQAIGEKASNLFNKLKNTEIGRKIGDNPDDIDIVRKYYNQPEAIEYFKKLPNYGAVVNSFDSVPIDKKYWKQYAKENLVGKSVDIPNYTTVSFTRNNLNKDYPYNMPEYPTLFDQLKGSNYAFSTNYKNEKDRIYDHFVNTNDNRLFDYLIEVIKDNEGDYHHNYKMMKNISRGDIP